MARKTDSVFSCSMFWGVLLLYVSRVGRKYRMGDGEEHGKLAFEPNICNAIAKWRG